MLVLRLLLDLGFLLVAGTLIATLDGAIYRWRRLRAERTMQSHGFPVIRSDATQEPSQAPRDDERNTSQ